jgi:hypothetical protein
VVTVDEIFHWLVLHRKMIAIGIAMVAPWVWMIGLDRLLRRTR